jgi:hypothetical protein
VRTLPFPQFSAYSDPHSFTARQSRIQRSAEALRADPKCLILIPGKYISCLTQSADSHGTLRLCSSSVG